MRINNFDSNSEFASLARQRIFIILLIVFSLVYIGRLAYLQIIKGDVLRIKSQTQAIKENVVEPFRGNIYDRNGKLIVHNEPSFSVTITPNEFKMETLPLLLSIVDCDTSVLYKILDPKNKDIRFTPIKITRDIDFRTLAMLEENADLLPGVDVIVESKRLYAFQDSVNMSHLLGYAKEISDAQLKQKKYYRMGDIVGQDGIEYSYEEQLFGKKGIRFVAVNNQGKKVESFDNGKSDIPCRNGFDLYLTIDKELQILAEKLLGKYRGAVVAIDPNTGEILALASKPDFDIRKIRGKLTPEMFQELYMDPEKAPMVNRAINAKYPPGSTWKMLIAIAGLNEGIINENTTLFCGGSLTLGNRTAACHGGAHGNINVRQAIQASCNVFFYRLALKIGMKNLEKYGKMFGFGNKLGIDIPNEKPGLLPTTDWLKKYRNLNSVPDGMMINYGIGQGEIQATPLQMASYVATIANKGTLYQPHVVRAMYNNMTNKIEPLDYYKKQLPINNSVFDIIHRGMFDVVNTPGGTALGAAVPGVSVCGKTGTAQNKPGLMPHSWFVCFAPKENPKIAMCVFVENAGYGGAIAAPIAKELLNYYFFPDAYKSQHYKDDSLVKKLNDSQVRIANNEVNR